MKSYFLLMILLGFTRMLSAQDLVIHASKKVSEEVTPQQVVDSLKKKFPDAKAVEYYQTPAKNASNGWSVDEEDNLDGETIDFYTLSFKRDDAQYYGLFKADGTLVNSKFEEKNVPLPDPVKNTLKTMAGSDYKNYNIQSKNYFKNISHSHQKEYYEVTAINKKDKSDKKQWCWTRAAKCSK